MRSTSPTDRDDDRDEGEAAPAALLQKNVATSYSFALVNWGGGGGASENAAAYASLVTEAVQSCERVVLDARRDALQTLRHFINFASAVAVTAIVAYCLVQIVAKA